MIRRLHPLLLALLTVASLGSPISLRAQDADGSTPDDGLDLRFSNGIAAIVENKVITIDDVRREIRPYLRQVQQEAHNQKEYNDKLEALQDEIIQNLVDRVLIVKEFRKDDKKQIPASFVDNEISDRLQTDFEGDRSKFLAYLKSKGETQKDFRREVEEDIIYHYMLQQNRKSQNVVSPVKVETYYNENKKEFYQEDQAHLRSIQLTRLPGMTDGDLMAKAAEIQGRLDTGEKFEDLAKVYSQDPKRARGGDNGWVKKTDLKPIFADAIFALKPGEATKPIVLPEGCFIYYMEERKFAGIQSIGEVREQIEKMLAASAAREANEHWLERLRRDGYVKLF